MALFWTDSIALTCSNVERSKRWWIEVFVCKENKEPPDWDDPLPSDVALQMPGADRPAIYLSLRAQEQKAGLERAVDHRIVFCSKLEKAQKHLLSKGVAPGPIQEAGGTHFFEIHDPDGNVIEICKEP